MNFTIEVLRQDNPKASAYWQRFEVPMEAGMTVEEALALIRRRPVTVDGIAVRPIAFSSCGGLCECSQCTLYANGRIIQICQTKVEDFSQPLRLEPLFPHSVVRDLFLETGSLYQSANAQEAYPQLDALHTERVALPKKIDELADALSACVSCGACVAACPQVNSRSKYLGAFGLVQKRIFDGRQGTGAAWLGEEGVSGCGESQNCVLACPLDLPVTEALASLKRKGFGQAIASLFGWR